MALISRIMEWVIGSALMKSVSSAVAVFLLLVLSAQAQTLRFENHREIVIPPDAPLRIGPFYSTMTFSQTAGYRYTRSTGAGTTFLFDNNRGEITEDGYEFPLVSSLDLRNYLIITRQMDLDVSVNVSYAHYPMKTQEDAFNVVMAPAGAYGNLSSEFTVADYANLKGVAYDKFEYKTEYVDTRGIEDRFGGRKYTHFNNTAGANLDWLIDQDNNLALTIGRDDVVSFSDDFDSQSRFGYMESAALEHKFDPVAVGGLRASYGQNFYKDKARPDSFFSEYSVYSSARLTDRSVGNASVGYSMASVSGSGAATNVDDSGMMVGQASVETELGRNLKHSIGYMRGQRAGFVSSFEAYSAFSYRLAWQSDLTSVSVHSTLGTVEPGDSTATGYSDWASGIDIKYPLNELVALLFSSTYSVRQNKQTSGDTTALEPEQEADYSTWVSRLGTSMQLLEKISFSMYGQHSVRMSDLPQLEYTRDTFEATFAYSYKF